VADAVGLWRLALAREQWTSRLSFILASTGAAVGIGNIWRFSYVAGQNGGGAFLIVYISCVLIIGLPLLIAELALGRRGQGDAVVAFAAVAPRSPWVIAGGLGVLAASLILAYYAVIAGWFLKYLAGALLGTLWHTAGEGYDVFFARFITHPIEPIVWQLVTMATTVVIVAAGVRRGIERANRVLMPMLALVVLGLAVHSLSLPGAADGVSFLFAPDWSALKSPSIYLAALEQAFFSIGIGMAIFITYGGYLAPEQPIPSAPATIALGDTLVAVLARCAILPAVFAFGLDPAAGPELVFVTLPQIFLAMPFGRLFGSLFFLLLIAAALTSMISLLEASVALAIRVLGLPRWSATMAMGLLIFTVGTPAAAGFGPLAGLRWDGRSILDSMDHVVSNIMLPVSGLLTALFVGWRWREALVEAGFGRRVLGPVWLWLVRLVAPALILAILLRSLGLI
jgi:NSS family neurotransmitter:Na+ symporter